MGYDPIRTVPAHILETRAQHDNDRGLQARRELARRKRSTLTPIIGDLD